MKLLDSPSMIDGEFQKQVSDNRHGFDAVLALVIRNSDILLIKRDIPGLNSDWIFPGGKLEGAETALEAAQREVFEETGVYCTPIKIAHIRTHPLNNRRIAYVVCEYQTDARHKAHEFPARWFGANYLPTLLGNSLSKQVRNIIHNVKVTKKAPGISREPRLLPTLPGLVGKVNRT